MTGQPTWLYPDAILSLDRPARSFTGTSVGLRLLPTHWQPTPVTQSAVATQIHQSLDVHCYFTAQITLYGNLGQLRTYAFNLGFSQITYLGFRVHADSCANLKRARSANTIDVRQAHPSVLLYRNIDSCYASHVINSCRFLADRANGVLYRIQTVGKSLFANCGLLFNLAFVCASCPYR
jgi:hypothetical protein